MQLSEQAIQEWIEALKRDPDATATAQPPQHPIPQFTKSATWRLTVFGTAYFYTPTQDDVGRVSTGIPDAAERFDHLTGGVMGHFIPFDVAVIRKKGQDYWEGVRKCFEAGKDDIAGMRLIDVTTKEASPVHAISSLAAFKKSSQPGAKFQKLGSLTMRVPLAFWTQHTEPLRRWWLDTLRMLGAEQAYLGLGFGNPPQAERLPFIEPAEFALAKAFYGLDIDKPDFMCASPRAETKHYLEHGMRTPTFGVLVSPKYLLRVGGSQGLRAALADEPRIGIESIGDSLWLQAGAVPELFPVEQGIPRHVARMAQALQPARLDALWLLSYLPALPREDRFAYESARRWLRRFDEDGDWPEKASRFWRDGKDGNAATRPPSTPGGEPCPRAGWWFTPAAANSRRHFRQGETMPDLNSAWGATIWQWDRVQDGGGA